ncbi:MAG: FKBP-type peptidyl-prolyl cis-trans isomerase [Candidatus Woesearchaeota archaeon]
MAEKVKKGDHVELVYVGREKQTGNIFDLNDANAANKEGVHNPKAKYDGLIVSVGQKDVIEGLDDDLVGKETEKSYKVSIHAQKAFGPKDSKLIQLVSLSKFKKDQMPFPGLQVEVNGKIGVVKTVSGGRVMLDFNHPLAGREVEYDYTIKRIVADSKEKVQSFFKMYFNANPDVDVTEGKALVHMDIPKKFADEIAKKIKERVPELKEVEFKIPEAKEAKTPPKKE